MSADGKEEEGRQEGSEEEGGEEGEHEEGREEEAALAASDGAIQ